MTSKRDIERRLDELETPEEIPVMTTEEFMLFDLKRCAVEHGNWSADRGPDILDKEEGIVRLNGETRQLTEKTFPDFVLDE